MRNKTKSNKSLYESIMTDVSKIVRKRINEFADVTNGKRNLVVVWRVEERRRGKVIDTIDSGEYPVTSVGEAKSIADELYIDASVEHPKRSEAVVVELVERFEDGTENVVKTYFTE